MRMVWRIRQIIAMFIVVVTTLLSLIISSTPEPYHMSIPSGQGWVEELLEPKSSVSLVLVEIYFWNW